MLTRAWVPCDFIRACLLLVCFIRAASRLYHGVCRCTGDCHSWIFWVSGIFAFLHVPTPFFRHVWRAYVGNGGARAASRTILFSTSSCSRGHLLHLPHRDVQHVRRLRRALSFTDTLEICRFVVGRWGGGELCTMVSACICVVDVLCMSSRLSCCRDNRPLTPPRREDIHWTDSNRRVSATLLSVTPLI